MSEGGGKEREREIVCKRERERERNGVCVCVRVKSMVLMDWLMFGVPLIPHNISMTCVTHPIMRVFGL